MIILWFFCEINCYSQLNVSRTEVPIFTDSFFELDKPFFIDLTFDVRLFKKDKPDFYIPALITIKNDTIINKDVRIKVRGSFRKDYCTFPSYWINFKNTNLVQDSIYNTNKIKIVSHCKKPKNYSSNLLKEYIAYKLYNIITDNSFRVCLLNVNYVSNTSKKRFLNRWAIMIEPESFLAERIETYPLKMKGVKYAQLDSVNEVKMAFFQYMIGNTDFLIRERHNIKLFVSKDYRKEKIVAIPYDFDYCGLVNADYAVPSSKMHINSVRERYYYGACRSDSMYNLVIEHYISKEQEIIEFISTFEYISEQHKKSILKYIERFYTKIKDEKFIEKELRPLCIQLRKYDNSIKEN